MKTFTLSAACLVALGALSLQAQVVWDANLTTGVPQFDLPGVADTLTFDGGPNGKGAIARPSDPTVYRYMYVPVTAPQGSVFACIGLRAQDSSAGNFITAEFYRQPRTAAGPATLLGAVTTNNAGFQYVQNAFAAVPINYPAFTYYVRIKFWHPDTNSVLRGFDVSLLSCGGGGA